MFYQEPSWPHLLKTKEIPHTIISSLTIDPALINMKGPFGMYDGVWPIISTKRDSIRPDKTICGLRFNI